MNENAKQNGKTATELQTIKIEIARVMKVYSGKAGRCCCGCSGKYSYAAAHVAAASKDRGYDVSQDEVSDRSVKIIVAKIHKLMIETDSEIDVTDEYVSAEFGGRLLIAYFVPAVVPAPVVDFQI